jgi:hypothetical protein
VKSTLVSAFLMLAWVTAGQLGCSVVVGADFDVFLRKKDAADDRAPSAPPPNDAAARNADGSPDAADDAGARNTDGSPDAADDAGARSDARGTFDALSDANRADGGGSTDANDSDPTDGRSADDASDGGDVLDPRPEPRPEGGIGPTVTGDFVGSGMPAQASSGIELRGHIISNGTIAGRTAGGISIEGRFR